MANRDTPMGFTPVGMLDGSEIPVRIYKLTSAHIRVGVGDQIECLADGYVDGDDDPTASPEKILGIASALYDSDMNPISSGNSSISTKYIAASVGGYVGVSLAVPNAVFQIQSSGTVAEADRFSSADAEYTACDTTTGRSKMELEATARTGAYNWLIIDKVEEPGNAWGEFVELLVIPCESYFVGTTAQVRVGI